MAMPFVGLEIIYERHKTQRRKKEFADMYRAHIQAEFPEELRRAEIKYFMKTGDAPQSFVALQV